MELWSFDLQVCRSLEGIAAKGLKYLKYLKHLKHLKLMFWREG